MKMSHAPSTCPQFCGEYRTRPLADGRIRLPRPVVRQLRPCGVAALRPGISPEDTAVLLWPEARWEAWFKQVQHRFPGIKEGAGLRAFVAPCVSTKWDSQGRLYISSRLLCYAGISTGQDVVIVGMLDHFEIWASDVFEKTIAACQSSFQSSTTPTQGTCQHANLFGTCLEDGQSKRPPIRRRADRYSGSR